MKEYTATNPQFNEKIIIVETTDPAHADNVNAAPKTLIENDLYLKEQVEEAQKAAGAAGGKEFDATKAYEIGDYCTHDGKMYRCTTAVATESEWDAASWEETNAADEIEEAKKMAEAAGQGTDSMKLFIIGAMPNHYEREELFTPAKTAVTIHANTQVNIGGKGYCSTADTTLQLADCAGAANRKGKDMYVYACTPDSGTEPKFVLSMNSTVPTGRTADNSRKIGGFHCLCADVGTISGHKLSGYVAGDILPASVWDLKHRPVAEPEGMVYVAGLGKWYDIYLASWDGSRLVSAFGGTIADGASARKYHGLLFNEDFGKIGKHLPCWDEFMVFAKGSNEQTAISGASDPGTAGGHKDSANRRMISNDGLEDCCGALWQWMRDTFDITSTNSNAAYTAGNRYISHNVFADSTTDSAGNKQKDTNWHIEPVYEPAVDSQSYGWVYNALLVRLLAGGNWSDASMCGSRSAHATNFGANVASSIGGRGASESRNAA